MKQLILYFPLKNTHIPLKHPYQEKLSIETKQEALLASFPSDVQIYMARGNQSHLEGNTFRPQFMRTQESWIAHNKIISADLVLGFEIPRGVTKVFSSMRRFTQDKTLIEKIFPKLCLKSIECKNYADIQKNFSQIQSHLKVLKPKYGTRSRGIFIESSLPVAERFQEEHFPYLLQEFHDTSHGFYEFPGMHDFRIILLNGEIIGKFLRQPAPGKYTANSYKRGNFIDLEDWTLPREILEIITKIENYCSQKYKHRYYSIDIGMGPQGEIKIFELNSAPGLSSQKVAQKLGEYIYKHVL